MITEVIKIQADLKNATKEIEKLSESIVDLQKEQKKQSEDAIAQAKEQQKATEKGNSILKKTAKGFKGVGLAMKAAGFGIILKLVDKLSEQLMRNQEVADTVNVVFTAIGLVFKDIADVLKGVFERVSETTGGFDALKKVLGGAFSIALNTIVLAIQGITLGVQKAQLAWEDSFLGGKDPEKIKELQANIDETRDKIGETADRIKTAGSEIATNFVEAVGEVGTLVQGVAEGTAKAISDININTAIENAKSLVELRNNYELLALQQERLRQEAEQEAEVFRTIRDDSTRSIDDRIKANEEFIEANKKAVDAEKTALQSRIDAIQQTINLEGESVELKNQLFQLNTELEAIELKRTQIEKENKIAGNALQVEKNNLLQTELQAQNELEIANKRFNAEQELNEVTRLEKMRAVLEEEKLIELERLQNKIDTTQAGTQARIDAEAEFNRRSAELKNQADALDTQLTKAKDDRERATTDLKLQLASQSIGAIMGLAKQGSKAAKAMAIAQATIDTYKAVNGVFANAAANPSTILFPAYPYIQAGIALAQGLGTVKSILSTPEAPTSPSPASAGGGAIQVPATPPAFNVVGASDTNQLASAIAEKEDKPMKAYVVSGDVSTAQELDRNIVEGASIG